MKIRYRFWFGLVSIVLLFAAFGIHTVVSSRSALIVAKEGELVGLAAALSDSISHRIEEQVHFLEYLRLQRFAVVNELSVANGLGPERDALKRRALEREWQDGGELVGRAESTGVSVRLQSLMRFLEERQGFPVFTEVFMTDVHGRVVGMTDRTSDFFQDDEQWWADAMRFGIVADSLEFDESSGSYGLLAAVRLDDELGRPMGVVKGVLNLEGIVRQVQRDKLSGDADLLLFDEGGRLLFSSRGGFESFGREFSGSELLRGVRGSEGFFHLEESVDLPYVAYHGLSVSERHGKWFSWMFMIRQGGDSIFAQVNRMVGYSLVFLVVVLALVLVMGLFVSRRVANPIERLAEVLEKTSTGVERSEVPSELKESKDEIGRLARSFDRMLYSLRMAVRKGPGPKGEPI